MNLLLPRDIGRGEPGDTKAMLQSRRDFLNKGYYQQFSDRLNDAVARWVVPTGDAALNILDAGCGEGYYTWRLHTHLQSLGRAANLYGIDVARAAISYAVRRDRGIRFAVASTFHLPMLPASLDGILCVFAPRDEEEFRRVLKPAGALIVAAPGPRHLYGLKLELYENPEYIGERGTVGEGFTLLDSLAVAYDIYLERAEDIANLVRMTPYIRHTEAEAVDKLAQRGELTTEVDFTIMVYRKA